MPRQLLVFGINKNVGYVQCNCLDQESIFCRKIIKVLLIVQTSMYNIIICVCPQSLFFLTLYDFPTYWPILKLKGVRNYIYQDKDFWFPLFQTRFMYTIFQDRQVNLV